VLVQQVPKLTNQGVVGSIPASRTINQ
jgi:hypothetical protein